MESENSAGSPVDQQSAFEAEGERFMFCTNCGAKNSAEANFCKQCGHKLAKVSAPKISDEQFAIPDSDDEKVKELLLKAYKTYEAGMVEEAITICEAALLLRPSSTDAHSLMSTLLEKKGDFEKAISEREKVLKLNPGSIADREKLDELRGEAPAFKPGKINYSRPVQRTSFMDSTVTHVVIAVLVVVVIVALSIVGLMSGKKGNNSDKVASESSTRNRTADAGEMPVNRSGLFFGNQQSVGMPNQGNQAQFPNNPVQQNNNRMPQNQQATNNSEVDDSQSRPRPQAPVMNARQINPAQINLGGNGNNQSETVHLPDATSGNGLSLTSNPPPNNTAPANTPNTTPTNTRPQGRIEIVVAPNQGFNTPNNNKSNNGIKISPENPNVNTASFASSDIRNEARRLQSGGQYKQAISQYMKALDGAGDDAASIHQNIAICYQRIEDNGSAIEHYNAAIKSYKDMIAAGKNVDAANRGIRSCENGIAVCK